MITKVLKSAFSQLVVIFLLTVTTGLVRADDLSVTFTSTPSDGGTVPYGQTISGSVSCTPALDGFRLSPQPSSDHTAAPGQIYYGSATFSYTPTAIGAFKISVVPVDSTLNGQSESITVITSVAFSGAPTELGIGATNNNHTGTINATVAPPGRESDVTFECIVIKDAKNGTITPNSTEVGVSTGSPTAGNGSDTVPITVTASGPTQVNADTTGGKPDIEVAAVVDGVVEATAPIVVLEPWAIGTPHSQPSGPVVASNEVLSATTSPAVTGLGFGQVYLATVYVQQVPIQVVDQFGNPLDKMYSGAEVYEYSPKVDINQSLSASGTYTDPVGASVPRAGQSIFEFNDPEVSNWSTEAKGALSAGDDTLNIAITIGSVGLNTGIVGREQKYTPPSTISVIWP